MQDLTIHYQLMDGGVRLLRCFGAQRSLMLPASIDGRPLAAIGARAFSDGYAQPPLPPLVYAASDTDSLGSDAPISGQALEEIHLPRTVASVGDYAFFKCSCLKRLSLYGGTRLGGGAFKNCRGLREIEVFTENGKSALKDILGENQHEIQVLLHIGGQTARLTFPPFYEESIENAPARIFEWFDRGSGYRYRQCFSGGAVDFADYDALFATAQAEDLPETVARLALDRLRFPVKLQPRFAEEYRAYLRDEAAETAALWVRAGEWQRLRAMEQLELLSRQAVETALDLAARLDRPDFTAYLLDLRHRTFETGRSRFAL